MTSAIVRANELHSFKGRPGRLGVGRTKFLEDYVSHPDRPEEGAYVAATISVLRLKPIALGSKAIGFLDDEIDRLIEGLRRERDKKRPRHGGPARPRPRKLREAETVA